MYMALIYNDSKSYISVIELKRGDGSMHESSKDAHHGHDWHPAGGGWQNSLDNTFVTEQPRRYLREGKPWKYINDTTVLEVFSGENSLAWPIGAEQVLSARVNRQNFSMNMFTSVHY